MWLPIIPFYSIRTNRNVAYHTVFLHFLIVEKQIPTQGEYMGTLSERYDIVLSRCEGLLNIIEKERALAFSLNDRYKKSDDCIKIIGNTLDSICTKLDVQTKVGVTQPSMPKTLKEVPSFLLCTIPWYRIRPIWYSRHVRQLALILMLCSWICLLD